MEKHGFYKRAIDNFAKTEIENEIENSNIEFEVIENTQDIDLKKNQFKPNTSIPLTFGYINKNIKKDYIIRDTEKVIEYNGSILKNIGIPISAIKSQISFDIVINSNLNKRYVCHVLLDLPITEDIYNGNQTVILNYDDYFTYEK